VTTKRSHNSFPLAESEERYRIVAETASDAIVTIDRDSIIQFANPGAERLFGHKVKDMLGQKLTMLMPEMIRPSHLSGIKHYLSTGERNLDWNNIETTALRKDGAEIPINISFGEYKSGDQHLFTAIIRDVTERKWAEERLLESEEDFRGLVEATTQYVWQLDERGNLHEFPQWWVELTGQGYEESRNYGWLEFIHPDDREQVKQAYVRALETQTQATLTLRLRDKDGNYKFFAARGVPLFREDGRFRKWICTLANINERMKAEHELRRSEERFRALVQASAQAVWTAERDGSSKELFEWFTELCGKPITSVDEIVRVMHPDDIEPSSRAWAKALEDRSLFDYVCRFLTRDGDYRYFASRGYPMFDADGNFRQWIGTFTDVTDKIRAQESLEKSEIHLRTIINSSPECIKVVDSRGRLIEMNRAGLAVVGAESFEQIDGQPALQLVAPEFRDQFAEMHSRVLNGSNESLEFEIIRLDGERRWVETHAVPLRDQRGNITSVLSVARDMTDRRAASEALVKSEERFRELFENANDLIYTHDLEGNFTSLNRAGETITGYTRDQALKLNIRDVVAPEYLEQAGRMTDTKLSGEAATAYETVIVRKDGRRIPIEVSTRLILENGVPAGVQGIARDVTERHESEEALRKSEEQLAQAQKLESIGRLAGGIAHDFNNMLTAINGYSELTLRRLSLDDPLRKNIEEIRKAGKRSADLTNQLLAFSRRQMLQPQIIDLNDTIEETAVMLRRLIGEDIELSMNLAGDIGRISADRGQLAQILVNLVVNSRDAIPETGSIIIETKNVNLDEGYSQKHFSISPGRYVMLAVSDTGHGIDEETRKHIFEPFFTTKETGKGTGLGLATVYGIVKQSGGNIWVYSEVDKGTTIKIYFPRVEDAAEINTTPLTTNDFRFGSEKILLVEDEEVVRSLAREVLESCGYSVTEARNGVEALEIVNNGELKIDMLMTDVVMPEMGGRELAEKLAGIYPKLKILFTSGYTDSAATRHGFLDEGANFLPKPFTFNDLAQKVREMLDAT
jgi:PAS domain S-box-containing protein